MFDINSFGGQIGNICWQNTWHELWGHAGFWDKRPGVKPRFILFGIRPKQRDSHYLPEITDELESHETRTH